MPMPHPARRAAMPLLVAAIASLTGCSAIAAPAEGAVTLQPHRIAYEVSLGPKRGRGEVTAARGLIALEFTGNACDGYATNFRQATQLLDADGNPRNLELAINHWEDGEGKRFRFTVRNAINGQVARDADGEARRVEDGSVSVTMRRPPGRKGDFDGAINFPSTMMLGLIRAAQGGERRFETRLFDGSEGGEKVFDTQALIGLPLAGDRNARLEPAMRIEALAAVPRWPVSVSYFETGPGDRVPVFTLRSVTFANGVVSDLVFEFPEFSLAAKAVRYESLPIEPCKPR